MECLEGSPDSRSLHIAQVVFWKITRLEESKGFSDVAGGWFRSSELAAVHNYAPARAKFPSITLLSVEMPSTWVPHHCSIFFRSAEYSATL